MPLSPRLLIDLLEHRRIGAEYQPLVSCADNKTVGFEALARFFLPDGRTLPPQSVFDLLHASPITLFQVEYAIKQLQVAHAPTEGLLFLNLDPDAFQAGKNGDDHPLVEVVRQAGARAVVEIIENSSVSDAEQSQEMALAFQAAGIRLALDDIGEPRSMLSLPVLLGVDYFKMDRCWLQYRHRPDWMTTLSCLISLGRQLGKTIIMEGVETQDQLDFAREIGCDLVQGWLYRDRFITVRA